MFRARSFQTYTLGALLIVATCIEGLAQPSIPGLTSDPAKARFVYDDVVIFNDAFNQLTDGVDSVAILQAEYLDKGSPGLKVFIEKYGLTAQMLVEAIQNQPEKYSALKEMPDLLVAYTNEAREAYRELGTFIPDIVYPPTYFLIGAHRGIGSSSAEGSLLAVESWPIPIRDRMSMLVHEMVHFQQARIVGVEKYVALYGAEKNLLGLSLREGVPEFFTDLVLGEITQTEALEYVLNHETRLWDQFKGEMHGSETGDWMWTLPSDPEQPPYVGYALGFRIAKAYYENAADKEKALREILSVTDYPAFIEKSGYGQNALSELRK